MGSFKLNLKWGSQVLPLWGLLEWGVWGVSRGVLGCFPKGLMEGVPILLGKVFGYF